MTFGTSGKLLHYAIPSLVGISRTYSELALYGRRRNTIHLVTEGLNLQVVPSTRSDVAYELSGRIVVWTTYPRNYLLVVSSNAAPY